MYWFYNHVLGGNGSISWSSLSSFLIKMKESVRSVRILKSSGNPRDGINDTCRGSSVVYSPREALSNDAMSSVMVPSTP